jgi:phosphoribosylformimino-5-aminoimidazole carboxamide ribotide isomerase
MSFVVYPAIDVREGRVVRLNQGDYARETRYSPDPFELACTYAEAGAAWLHLVDLDAARTGGYSLQPLVRRIAETTSLRIQTGGGIRAADDVASLLDAGATRVVIGSLAVREPELVADWIARFGAEHVTLALDTRADADGTWRLPVHGWTEASGRGLTDTLSLYFDSGLRHVLCTDIARDGMLSGPNLDLYRQLRRIAPWLQVQASGGARDAADVQSARITGCAGIVLGKALLEGRLLLPQALAC